MANPFLIQGPASISFSGGRTSGMMLKLILDAHGGRLPPNVFALFTNTGRERNETLDFVRACETRWGVDVIWLERTSGGGVRQVDHASASRCVAGEVERTPWSQLLSERNMLPNVRARFCTTELKVRTMHRWIRSVADYGDITTVIGFRADEPDRVANRRKRRPRSEGVLAEHPTFPLHDAGITVTDVMAFWAAQPFDLQLKQHEGNCDLCFLKSLRKRVRIMADRPDLATKWIADETRAQATATTPQGARFRQDGYSYAKTLKWAQEPTLPGALTILADDAGDLADCACTD